MTHNYFLYNNTDTSMLTWIPRDNNEALQSGNRGGAYDLDFSGLSAISWPLIGYLYNDDVYKVKYDAYLQEVIDDVFSTSKMQALYTTYAMLIEPYATSEVTGYTFLESSSDFQSAIATLKSHAAERATAVSN